MKPCSLLQNQTESPRLKLADGWYLRQPRFCMTVHGMCGGRFLTRLTIPDGWQLMSTALYL